MTWAKKITTFLPFPWIVENSNFFLFLFYFLDFVLENKASFPMAVLEYCLFFVILESFTP